MILCVVFCWAWLVCFKVVTHLSLFLYIFSTFFKKSSSIFVPGKEGKKSPVFLGGAVSLPKFLAERHP